MSFAFIFKLLPSGYSTWEDGQSGSRSTIRLPSCQCRGRPLPLRELRRSSHFRVISRRKSGSRYIPVLAPFISSAIKRYRYWRRSNYGTFSRFIGHRKPCGRYSSGQCASTFGKMPCDAFTISTYLVLQSRRVGIWLCFFYTHLVKYAPWHLTRSIADP